MIHVIFIITLIVTIGYALLQLYFIYGWLNRNQIASEKSNADIKVAFIVPFRNEAESIIACINSLVNQDYSLTRYQIVLVDDHSEDESFIIASKIAAEHTHVKLLKLPDDKFGKKNAITLAIQQTDTHLVFLTDADCVHHKNYLNTMVAFYLHHRPRLIAGEVKFGNETDFIEKFQSIELSGLMLITSAAFKLNFPFLCNGANLIFEKSFFETINGYSENESVVGGDDIFLLQKAKATNAKTMFISHPETAVITKPQPTFSGFFDQRFRWAHKSKYYTDAFSSFVSMLVFTNSLLLLLCPFLLLFSSRGDYWALYFISLIIKFIIDFLLLFLATQNQKKTKLLWYFPLAEIFQIVYVFIIGVMVLFSNNINWKGRKLYSGKKI
jgi:cellulose synthase/poly-beta-1,6-N-acetylglucosamine synthase-like glycosyltransferase